MSKLLEIKEGQKAVYVSQDPSEGHPSVGTILTRKETWMDCESSVAFSFIRDDGTEDYEYFFLTDIELIEETV